MAYTTELSEVRISKDITSDVETNRMDTQAHYLEITAEAINTGDDVNIFVHQLETNDSDSESAFFTNVCSPSDYNELPVGLPGQNQSYTLFRIDKIRHYGRSHEELENLYSEVVSDVQALIKAFTRASNLESSSVDLG